MVSNTPHGQKRNDCDNCSQVKLKDPIGGEEYGYRTAMSEARKKLVYCGDKPGSRATKSPTP